MIAAAAKDPNERYVIVIEEINRGNPAQIFERCSPSWRPTNEIPTKL